MPEKLVALAADLKPMDRGERSETPIDYADRFFEVAASIAMRPFDDCHRAPRCESEAHVWATDYADRSNQPPCAR